MGLETWVQPGERDRAAQDGRGLGLGHAASRCRPRTLGNGGNVKDLVQGESKSPGESNKQTNKAVTGKEMAAACLAITERHRPAGTEVQGLSFHKSDPHTRRGARLCRDGTDAAEQARPAAGEGARGEAEPRAARSLKARAAPSADETRTRTAGLLQTAMKKVLIRAGTGLSGRGPGEGWL